MAWDLWQSVQTGTSGLFVFASACPWTLFANASASDEWQPEQVSEIFVRGSFGFEMSCAPWQSPQKGADELPLERAAKWTLSSAFV